MDELLEKEKREVKEKYEREHKEFCENYKS